MTRHRVLLVTTDPLGARMPGPAIRAWHLAGVLAGAHQVTLASTVECTITHPDLRTALVDSDAALDALVGGADVIVVPPGVFYRWPHLAATDKVMVVDAYDPYHLENLEPGGGETLAARDERVRHLSSAINDHLQRADFVLCATERQRDFWLGTLAALGRVNASTYDEDPSLARLVAAVPFGIDSTPPRRRGPGLRGSMPGVGPGDKVVLWAGGIYNWLDPSTVIGAVDRLRRRVGEVRLVFLGTEHPNPAIPAMRAAAEARALAERLGLAGTHVFFRDGWVPYEERANFLLDADVGVSAHLDGLETRYSFRTRVLDYLWAGIPSVLTAGDVLSDVVSAHRLGLTVASGDAEAMADALEKVLDGDAGTGDFAPARAALSWEEVARPLVEFCSAPRRAADLATGPAPLPEPPAAGAPADGRPAWVAAAHRLRRAWSNR